MTKSLLLLALLLGGAAPANAAAVRLVASLTGAQVPGGGDPDGVGSLTMEFNTDSGYMCYRLSASNLKGRPAAQIHVGAAEETGSPMLSIDVTGAGNDSCGHGDVAVLKQIAADPASYYVNVRNRQYPAGAIRGQLARK